MKGRIALGMLLVACSIADYQLVSDGFTVGVDPSLVTIPVRLGGGPIADAAPVSIAVTITPGARFDEPVTVTLDDAPGVVCAPITITANDAGAWVGALVLTADQDASSPGSVSAKVHATSASGFSSTAPVVLRMGKFIAISDAFGCRTQDGQTTTTLGPCSFVVPSDISEILVVTAGGGGGGGTGTNTATCNPAGVGGNGGFGGALVAHLRVVPGQTLDLVAGGGGAGGDELVVANGSGDPFFGAGGGGGGLSGIFADGGPLAIAGGGGGGGGGACVSQSAQPGAAGGSGSGAAGDPGGGFFGTFGGGGGGTADAGGANSTYCPGFVESDAGFLSGGGCANPGKIDGGTLYCFAGGVLGGGGGSLATGQLAMSGGGGGGSGWYGGGAGGAGCNGANHAAGGGGGGSGGVASSVWIADAGLVALTPDAATLGAGGNAGNGGKQQGQAGAAGFVWIEVP